MEETAKQAKSAAAFAAYYPLPEKWGQYDFFTPDAIPMRNEQLSAVDIQKFRDKTFIGYFERSAYLEMVEKTFGAEIREFLKTKVLSKKLVRPRY